jgi:hypothetical protein
MHTRADALRKTKYPGYLDEFLKETGIKRSRWNQFAAGTGILFEKEIQAVADIFGVEPSTFALSDGRAVLCSDWESAKKEAEDILKEATRPAKEFEMEKISIEIKHIPKSELLIDDGYQRTVNISRAKKMAKEWDWLLAGALTVAETGGRYFVIDGQHRLAAAKMLDDIEEMPCIVHHGLSQAKSADVFLGINTQGQKPTMHQRFKALVIAKDPIALEMTKDLAMGGYKVKNAPQGTGKVLNAISAVYNAYKTNQEHARRALNVCLDLQDGKPLSKALFWGVLEFSKNIERLDFPIPYDRWRQRLLRVGIRQIEDDVAVYTTAMRSSGPGNCGMGVLNAYNRNLKEPDRIEWIPAQSGRKAHAVA